MAQPPTRWGAAAAGRRDFRWRVHFGGQHGDVEFDTTDEACAPFGFRHNDAVRFTIPTSLWVDRRAVVLGVNSGCLWVQLEGEVPARDLKYCFDAADVSKSHGLVKLGDDEAQQLRGGAAGLQASCNLIAGFTPARDQRELRRYEYSAPMGIFVFDGSEKACAPFGYHHGQMLRATVGCEAGKAAVVIGVHAGVLWVHFDSDKRATACHYCENKGDLDQKYGWFDLSAPPRIPPATGPDPDADEEAAQSQSDYASGGHSLRQPSGAGLVSEDPVEPEADPADFIEYPGPFGLTHRFEKSDVALKLFGVRHGQRLRMTKGINAGRDMVIIGLLSGTLWVHEEGDRAATACKHCHNEADLRERYGYEKVGQVGHIADNTPVFTDAVYNADTRRREAAEILSSPVSADDAWEEGAQPQTYRFMRAYARWRLPKGTPRGQAFLLYYVKDTALRTTEALDNLAVLRKFWSLRRARGDAACAGPFAAASERQMFACMQQIPLQALTILSPTS